MGRLFAFCNVILLLAGGAVFAKPQRFLFRRMRRSCPLLFCTGPTREQRTRTR